MYQKALSDNRVSNYRTNPGLTVTQLSLGVCAHSLEGLCQRQPLLSLLRFTLAVQGRDEHDKVEPQSLLLVAFSHTRWREGAGYTAQVQSLKYQTTGAFAESRVHGSL